LRPRDGRDGRRGRRLCNTGEDEGDIDALHAGSALSSQIRYDLSKIADQGAMGGRFSDREIETCL
jgi:hypothetical protein